MSRHMLQGRRILLVEDEFFLADELARILIAAGVEVIGPVPSVESALKLLGSVALPDTAILDVDLGGEHVYPVADALLAHGVPFLFTTGYDQASIPDWYATARVLRKPMNSDVLIRELGSLFEARTLPIVDVR